MVTSVLVILSFALVLVAVVLLVLGLLASEGLGLIYASMACSLAAGIVLYAAVRMGRPQVAETPAGGPAAAPARPAPADAGERAMAASASEREALGTVAVLERERPEEELEEEPEEDETAAMAAVAAEDEADYDDDEDFFPIAEYDDLTVAEIMPLLPELYPEELDEVEERERATKSRVTILGRIEELRDEVRRREAGEEWGVPDEGWGDEAADEEEEAAATGGFPIAGYDDMTAPEVVKNLDGLSRAELQQVRAREAAGDDRVTVLREIDSRLESEAEAAAPARKATAKKAAKKKAAAKRATKKKAAAKKATTRKAAAKKGAAKKKAAAKKGAARKKAATKKASAKKSSRRR